MDTIILLLSELLRNASDARYRIYNDWRGAAIAIDRCAGLSSLGIIRRAVGGVTQKHLMLLSYSILWVEQHKSIESGSNDNLVIKRLQLAASIKSRSTL